MTQFIVKRINAKYHFFLLQEARYEQILLTMNDKLHTKKILISAC